MKLMGSQRLRQIPLVAHSPLRGIDPRTKMFISLAASLVVMLPLERLALYLVFYGVFLIWARLLVPVLQQIWRIKLLIILLFAVDWWLINLDHAILVCTRLILLAGTFTLFFSTTTAYELSLALERLKVPYRYAFSLSLAFQSIGFLEEEWRAIKEAQHSRGVIQGSFSVKGFIYHLKDFIALTVPAIVLTTKRAWMNTEAAYARGFDSPKRTSFYVLKLNCLDFVLLLGTLILILFVVWR